MRKNNIRIMLCLLSFAAIASLCSCKTITQKEVEQQVISAGETEGQKGNQLTGSVFNEPAEEDTEMDTEE